MSTQQNNSLPEIQISFKRKGVAPELPTISTSADAYQILKQNWNMGRLELQEEFKVIYLNRANKPIGIYPASIGGITGTIADPRLIMAAAVKCCAVALILCHNHPSGSLKPSQADEELTRKLKGAANFFDIKVLDHLIISDEAYFSFADEGII